MKRIYILFILLIGIINHSYSQTDRQFWFVAPAITVNHAGETPIYFRVTAGSLGANISISMPANLTNFPTQNHVIPPNTTLTINLSAYVSQIENNYDFLDGIAGKSNKGIYIESDNPITVYYEDAMTNNCDIFALKGKNGLGTEFYTVFQNKGYNMSNNWAEPATSAIDIVATVDGTIVTIESPLASQDIYSYGTANFSVTLNKGQTFSIPPDWNTNPPSASSTTPTCLTTKYATDIFGRAGADHLGGLHITSNANHPIAITKKDDSVRYYCIDGWTGGCYDLIGDQMVPLDILGKEYIAMRGALSSAPENVYIVATADNTDIFIDGNAVPVTTINRGQTYVYQGLWNPVSKSSVHIRGSEKLSVLHVSGFGCEVGGAILPPTDKCTGSTKVSVTRSTTEGFFFNLMVWSGAEDGFYINGVLQDDSPGTLFGPADFLAVPGTTNWKIWRSPSLPTATFPAGGTFTFENTKDVFHLGLINGGSSSGCRFGYFSDFNELRVDAQATGSLSSSIRACSYEKIQLYAQGGTDYNWWPIEYLDDPTSSTPLSNPPADTIMLFYVEVSGACGLTDTATVSVEKFPELESQFAIDQGFGCSPLELAIHEVSTQIKERYWDFNFTDIGGNIDRDTVIYGGSINYDTDTVFVHTFVNTSNEPIDTAQKYSIRLLVKNTNDCSDTSWASVNVYPEVTADFSISVVADTIGCSPHFVQYVNSSNNEDAYAWQFGDGVSSFTASPSHTFYNILNSDTVYTTRLVARSDYFCRDTAYMNFTVHPYLENGFTINKHEGCSPLDVTFTNGSVFADTIFLDFGDGNDSVMTTFTTVIHRYTNTGNTVDTNVVEMIVKNDEGCYEFAYDTIIVYPEIRANYTVDIPTYTGCNSQLFNFVNTSNSGVHTASSYLWTFGDGATSNTTAVNVPHTYTNSTSADQNYTFNLRAQSQYGCWDDTTHNIRINRAYANFVVNTDKGCSPLPVTITNTSVGTGITTWAWNFGDATNSALQNPPVKTYTNATGATLVRNMQLTVTGTGSCSTSKTIPISVYSSVDVTFTPLTQTGCDSLIIPFNSTILPNIAGTTYAWNFGDGTSSSSADITHIYRNLTSASNVIYTAQVTATTPNGCTDNASTTITVRPYVNALFTVDKVAGCTPLTVDAIATTYIGIPTANYVWSYGDGYNPTGITNPPAHIYPVNPAPGPDDTYPLRLTVSDPSGLCTDFMQKTVTVYAAALADFTPKEVSGCNPFTVDFANASSTNSTSFLWDFGDGTTTNVSNPAPKVFSNTTNATLPYPIQLTATTANGCTNSTSANIYVYRYVNADFAVNITEGCSPVTVGITNNSSGGNYRWYWNSQTGAGVADKTSTNGTESFTHTYTNTTGSDITYYLTVVAENANGCSELFTREILVHSSITAGFTYTQTTLCNPSDAIFTNTSVGGGTYTMNWDFGDGTSIATTSNTVNKTFTNNSTNDVNYTVILSAASENGCTDTYQDIVTVYSRVDANLSIPVSQGCPDPATELFNAAIENTSIGNVTDTYQWYVDNVAIVAAPNDKSDFNYSYQNSDPNIREYEVKLRATNIHGCYTEKTDKITVYEYVDAVFVPLNPNGCSPWEVQFDNQTSAPATNTNYLWEFGDNTSSGELEPEHLFYNASRTTDKSYRILLTVTSENYCTDTISAPITVYHQPLAKLYADPTSSCPPLDVTMNNFDSRGFDRFEWRFGDGNTQLVNSSVGETRTYSYPNPSIDNTYNYTLKLWVETDEGCWHMDSTVLNVFPDVIAGFTYDPAGCSPFVSEFTNTSSSPATQFFYDFNDGSTDNQPDVFHRFVNDSYYDKTFMVRLTASSEYNCWDTISHPVIVYAQPVALFNPTPTVQTFPENQVQLNSASNNQPWNYNWDFDDGLTSTASNELYHTYEHWGERDITLTLQSTTSSCNNAITKTIVIYPPEVNAAFTVSTDRGCEPLDIQFTAAASVYSEIYTYEWDFGDGTSGTGATPNHTYETAGLYYVKMIARGEGGEDYEYRTIKVYKNPVANFSVAPKLGMLNEQLQARVEYFNLSECSDTLGCTYQWSFGDENTSTEREGVHNYTKLGTYDVSLVVTTSQGCVDSLVRENEVTIIGEGQIVFPNAFTPNTGGPIGCRTDNGYDVYSNDIFFPVYKGVVKYELLIYTRWGELIFKSNDVDCGWDGYVDGKLAKQDVYVWKAQGKFTNGRAFEMAGDVTLIR